MNKIYFEAYKRPSGRDEFSEYLNSLPVKEKAKLLAVIRNTEKFGLLVAIKQRWVKQIDAEIYELRSRFSKNQQRALYFHANAGKCIITHGFTKKTNKTPLKEIKHAHKLMKEYIETIGDNHE